MKKVGPRGRGRRVLRFKGVGRLRAEKKLRGHSRYASHSPHAFEATASRGRRG